MPAWELSAVRRRSEQLTVLAASAIVAAVLATASGFPMMPSLRTLALAAGFSLLALLPARAADPENTLYLDVPAGRVVIELKPELAPKTVAHIKELTRRGFYDGLAFHRVIDGFMAQTGDPNGNGTGGSGQRLKRAEGQPAGKQRSSRGPPWS